MMHRSTLLIASACLAGCLAGRPAIAAKEEIVYSFAGGTDGATPFASLSAIGGMLYGTTVLGGADNAGTVFSISQSGIETVVHAFDHATDGARPQGPVAFGYGYLAVTTRAGGLHDQGTVVDISVATGAARTVHNFGAAKDGQMPVSPVEPRLAHAAYVTTRAGGTYGLGTVCAVSPSGKETVVHSFAGGSDGAIPIGGLLDVDGTFYGTTFNGGPNNAGTVFALTPDGTEHVIYSFIGGSDGLNPAAGYLIDLDGIFYGTTFSGGAYGYGTVFSVTPDGTEKVIYSFTGGTDGANSESGVIALNGHLFTTAQFGGIGNNGAVIELNPAGKEETLYDFQGGTDGANPEAAPLAVGGVLYGTTANGGANGLGTVFVISGMTK